MLPSQGLFRSIPCPFFLAGLCERPHCSFRHCRSDIRIDRKLEAETLDEPAPTNEKTSSPPSQTNEGVQYSSINKTSILDGSKEVIVDSPSNNNKSEPEVNKELENTRLKPPQNLNVNKSVDNHRKRSRDSESDDPYKRRRLSIEANEMGQLLSVGRPEKDPEPAPEINKKDRHKKDELDLLVEEIEKAGKTVESRKKGKHRRHKHKSRHSDSSPSETTSMPDTSHRKDDKSKHHDSHKRRDEKGKDLKDSHDSKKDHSKKDDHRRRKDSKDSSSSKSHKDSSRPRESSSSSSHKSERSSHKSKESSDSRKSTERRTSKEDLSGSERSQKPSATPSEAIAIPNNVDTINRFSALAESLLDESAYISDSAEPDDSFDFAYPSDSEDDPEMVARECLEMFENYQPELDPAPVQSNETNEKKEDKGGDFLLVGKKRVAHANAIMKPPSTSTPIKPTTSTKNLQETIVKRLEDQTKYSTKPSNGVTPLISAPTRPPLPPPGKMRIAHVPNAGKLAKPTHVSSSKSSSSSATSSAASSPNHSKISSEKPGTPGSLTYSQTAAKGVKRQAHQPTMTSTKPGPLVYRDAINKTTKIPHVTRQHIMDKMFAEYFKVLGNHEVAFETTVNRENELVGRCSTKQVYLSSGTSIISGLRKTNRTENEQPNGGSSRVIAHAHILSGGSLEAKNCSVRTAKKDNSLPKGNLLYKALRQYVATERQLVENGYPRPHPSGEAGRAVAKPRQGEENGMSLTRRICDRCKKRYETNPDGDHIILEVCNYHWGRKYNVKAKGGRGARECSFSCCGGDDDTIGCVTAVCHVSKCPIPISSQKGFVEAVLEEGPEEAMGNNPWDIIGIDCEMVYTTHGNELARVTVVGAELQVLYDEIVRTTHRVLDVNTRFSGITFEDMDRAKRGITEIQAILLAHIRPNTIIIGHSLESDLLALRIKHECVIDTSILYPHRMGPPKKRALKNISVEVLKKVIQEQETGHDSAEDAQIALELVLAKLKSDLASK